SLRAKEFSMKMEKHFKCGAATAIRISIALLSLCFFLASCTDADSGSTGNQAEDSFIGDWQGSGTDSEGNAFDFFAKVSRLGDNRYRILILDKLDTVNEPMHIMDGALQDNEFSYTSDEGAYAGGGTLMGNRFEGYYKGSVDGTFTMQRIE
ncbi:MAG: hypothetical protein P8Z37_12035, partial [Acidobacteriota bacterium]